MISLIPVSLGALRTLWTSSSPSPLDFKKTVLRSGDSFAIDSSCRNLFACSRSVARVGAVADSWDVELEFCGLGVGFAAFCCHAGIEGGFLESESAMMGLYLWFLGDVGRLR